jgi:hypothetical protein
MECLEVVMTDETRENPECIWNATRADAPTLAQTDGRAGNDCAPECDRTTAPVPASTGDNLRSRPVTSTETVDYSGSGDGVIASRSPVGRYTVLGRVAQGGMGVIFKVWDGSLHRPLAMKVIRGQDHLEAASLAPVGRQLLARFLREA